jgi:2,4-dienoyl-CoA reductase-like NADH-dependent reductase (Old Yellow Enzyme family)
MSLSTTTVAPAVDTQQVPTELLFQPARLGRYNLPHRIVMAPLTRSRARQPGNVPSALNACYYAQRASAALIVTERRKYRSRDRATPGRPAFMLANKSRAGALLPTQYTRLAA